MIEVNAKLQCKKCKTIIEHEYTQKDLEKHNFLKITCQNCNHEDQLDCKKFINQIKEEAIKEMKKHFKTK